MRGKMDNYKIVTNGGRGYGSLQFISLKGGGVWSVRLRDSKGKHKRIRLGTLEELPTEQAARAAAKSVASMGVERVAQLFDGRYKKRNGGACYTQQWYMEKLVEQGYKCAICQCTPKRLVTFDCPGCAALRVPMPTTMDYRGITERS
jgi:hypothetical protein